MRAAHEKALAGGSPPRPGEFKQRQGKSAPIEQPQVYAGIDDFLQVFADFGWPVFPLKKGGKAPATTDPAQIHTLANHLLKHGEDPGTRAQAAAHEAGHAILYAVLGRAVTSSKIWRLQLPTRSVWAGWTDVGPDPRDEVLWSAATDPARALELATWRVAGFAGETVAGLEHASSSLDERANAQSLCFAVGKAIYPDRENAAAVHYAEVWAFALAAIKEHRGAFDTLRAHLGRTRNLNRFDAARMLAKVPRKTPPWLAGRRAKP